MTALEVLQAVDVGEGLDYEFKSCQGGLSQDLWETYSAFANTNGGTIVLGVRDDDGAYWIGGVPQIEKRLQDLWNNLNNRGKVSVNLLSNNQVKRVPVGDKEVIVIEVPRATRKQRPVFIGPNPLEGTFRRNYTGDYKCSPEEVGRMLADQSDDPLDSQILPFLHESDLHPESIQQFRNLFSANSPAHPWLTLGTIGLLEKLGGWRKDLRTGEEGITLAGVLMFGRDSVIVQPGICPTYYVDYRERMATDATIRWSDRVHPDGTWVANLFQFYQRVYKRLVTDLRVPFQLGGDMLRRDDTPVHEAMREALVNALVHADYGGQGGIVIERFRDRVVMENPGRLLVSFEQLVQGGVSECRNKALQRMFQMIGLSERAGSGIDKIRQGWEWQKWIPPGIGERFTPDRVRLNLPFVSMLPEDSVSGLRSIYGSELDGLHPDEMLALVTAHTEGEVSNARLQLMSERHPADLSRMLRGLVSKGLLSPVGERRTTGYKLSKTQTVDDSPRLDFGDSPRNEEDSPHKAADSPHNRESSPHSLLEPRLTVLTETELAQLREMASEARASQRLAPVKMHTIVLDLCRGRFLSVRTLAEILGRHPDHVRERIVNHLVKCGKLRPLHEHGKNYPDQSYTTSNLGEGA